MKLHTTSPVFFAGGKSAKFLVVSSVGLCAAALSQTPAIAHGVQFAPFSRRIPRAAQPDAAAAGTIELIAGVLIVLGLFTRTRGVRLGSAIVGRQTWTAHIPRALSDRQRRW